MKVIVKKNFLPYFKIGDNLEIISILYEKDTVLIDTLYGVFDKAGNMLRIASPEDINSLNTKEFKLIKISEPVVAKKGTWKDSFLRFEDGRTYPGTFVHVFAEYFDKITE
jgi:hypothetical protein